MFSRKAEKLTCVQQISSETLYRAGVYIHTFPHMDTYIHMYIAPMVLLKDNVALARDQILHVVCKSIKLHVVVCANSSILVLCAQRLLITLSSIEL